MKRVVCLLLMPAVLLTQWAGRGHCHGGNEPAGHNLRPHVHTNPTSSGHSHDGHHHHGPGRHHHHHDEDEAPEPAAPPTPQPEPLPDHDSDAIFIDSVDVVVERSQAGDKVVHEAPWFAALSGNAASWAGLPGPSAVRPHPPPLIRAPDQPLYLRHLAFLI